ncbi:MAG: hypothetical protein AAGA54_29440, partial [Myxococcota bacterium]
MRGWTIVGALSGCLMGVAAACNGAAESSCSVGALDCACTPGGGCDPGLDCVEDVCIVVTTETTNPTTATTGTPDPTAGATSNDATTTPATSSSTTASGDSSSEDGGLILDVGSEDTDIGPTSGCRAIDIVFALDSSGSMIEERNALAATNAFSQILVTLEGLNGGGIDYRVGLTTANDHGWIVPLGWLEPEPWFDSEANELETLSLAFNGAVG